MSNNSDKQIELEWYGLEKEILSSKELTLHVMSELCGGYDGIWGLLMEHALIGDIHDSIEDGQLQELLESARTSMDTYLNAIVEKEVLGDIPKDS
jgi:hypothetical protein